MARVFKRADVLSLVVARLNEHALTEEPEGESWLAAAVAMASVEQMPVIERYKPLAEVVNIAEHSGELQLAHRDPLLLRLIRG
jgi:hypothetical protein